MNSCSLTPRHEKQPGSIHGGASRNQLCHQLKNQNLAVNLVLPWASILIIATVGAFYTEFVNHDEQDDQLERSLISEKDQVFNEEHEPLFPLSRSDYIGFFLAIAGLIVAVGRHLIDCCFSALPDDVFVTLVFTE